MALVQSLKNPSTGTFAEYVRGRLTQATRDAVDASTGSGSSLSAALGTLVPDLNAILGGASIVEEATNRGVSVRAETQALADTAPTGADLTRLNRMVLEDGLGDALVRLAAPAIDFVLEDGTLKAGTGITGIQEGGLTFVDVRFFGVGGLPLDVESINDTGVISEITLSGAGLGTATVADRAPDRLGSTTDSVDNDGDGQVDEADENVFRFYVSRGFTTGAVSVQFTEGSWKDADGNEGTSGSASFQLIEPMTQPVGSDQPVGRGFFMEISGGVKLQGLGFTKEPIIDIRGRVVMEFGAVKLASTGKDVTRFTLDASGTVKIIKLGNIGSVAARFVLQTGDTPSGDPEFWGVAKVQANLDFLKEFGNLRGRQRGVAGQHDSRRPARDDQSRGHPG